MEKYKVGVIGGTGMVGQRFVTLLENHPWFQLTAIAASSPVLSLSVSLIFFIVLPHASAGSVPSGSSSSMRVTRTY